MNQPSKKIGFIGAGKMAVALARGFLAQDVCQASDLTACDPSAVSREAFSSETGCDCFEESQSVIDQSDVIILAVKPQVLPVVAADFKNQASGTSLLISIAAGITLSQLEDWFGEQQRLVRVMPNTPALVGSGAAAFSIGSQATEGDREFVQQLLSTVGKCHLVPESLMNGVTGLSGSGPAYVFQFIEALSDGGVAEGLPRAIALELAAQTVLGAAKMVLETGRHPAELKDAVSSPGGTTIAGLSALEQQGFRAATLSAVRAASRRSRELAEESSIS